MSEMKIKAAVPWLGSKRNLAPVAIKLLGPHRVYWELFCGSMAVLFAKVLCVMETVVDLHADLTNLAKVLQSEALALKLYRRAARTLMSDQLHREARNRLVEARLVEMDSPDLDRAYDYLLCSWQGRNGAAGTSCHNSGFCVRYTSNGGHAAKRWKGVIESIPWWHQRLLNVTVLRRDVFGVGEKIEDKAGTAIYCDPPYFEKGSKYLHDFTDDDHERLATLLHRFRETRVVLSYYDHPKLDELYPRWTKHYITVAKAMSHQNKRGENKKRAVEVLLTNHDTSEHMSRLFQ